MNLYQLQQEEFIGRHIGPDSKETAAMLKTIGMSSVEELISKTVPASIRLKNDLPVDSSISESEYLNHVHELGQKNILKKNFIGMGYYGTLVPSVILRNLLENPGWYTQYTPYQAEIAQGRLESLLNFQTMVSDLTALPIANASLLDEATAAAEAMSLMFHQKGNEQKNKLFVDQHVFPQTLDVLITRSTPIGIEVVVGDYEQFSFDESFFATLIQYPNSEGAVVSYKSFIETAQAKQMGVIMACDLLSLALLTPPGELGADIALGSAQRFGVPLGFGGPHAAFFATKDEFKRVIPGRIIGVSVDANNERCLRMALQTREQHIRREKATSNICTAQALLANMAAMYAVYHGAEGIQRIAKRVSLYAQSLANSLKAHVVHKQYFDTIKIKVAQAQETVQQLAEAGYNVRFIDAEHIGISFDETTIPSDVEAIANILGGDNIAYSDSLTNIPDFATRTSDYLTHAVFNTYHSESKMMRYLRSLEEKDLALNRSMISLGSCTMKLNAASEMIPVSDPHWNSIHPFAPKNQWQGYQELIQHLEKDLATITGFDACSLQPNSGAQGEYAGLLVIKAYHESRGDAHRNVILIPISAHGTNPASAAMCNFKIVIVACDEKGNIDVADLKAKAEQHKENLAGLMVTYPSTHGVFEETIIEICACIHEYGGQVYMDGANMNAQVGLTSPGNIGADVCHLNLHKTFAIPHGGGGPGMGPICVKSQLAPFLPGHTEVKTGGDQAIHAVSAAPYGSASILLISYAYIKMLGAKGLKKSTEYAILNANYMKSRLETSYKILYTGVNGTCAHEFIVDLRPFKAAGIEAEDVAKRLMDFGFHAPTLSFPVAGTLMIEPTESEDQAELDRFCDALLAIREEIEQVVTGKVDAKNNVLKHAPHIQRVVMNDEWNRPYTRKQAAFPLTWVEQNKFWPTVSRVNNTQGDRNLICTCEPIESYMEA
ncbi:MAG: aminomethyl-transferring glycine dehydrogenase [Chitinophagaceae bacterium]|nr:aminomethyl-transferring glycine dehydrogenase [Chitinophagaceae bacterium]